MSVVMTSHAGSDLYDSIIKYEGINSIDSSQMNLTSLVDRIIKSKDKKLPYTLLKLSKEDNKSKNKDIYFVLFLLASSLSEKESFAYSEYHKAKSKLKVTYMDSEVNSPEELLGFSYFWLLNNTNFTVPESLISEHPKLFWNTPYWHATRDGYFDVTIENQKIKQLIKLPSFEAFFRILSSIYNPGGCSVGSMYNAKSKNKKINLFTLLVRPDYFQLETIINEDHRSPDYWLDYWQHGGQFEKDLYQRLGEAKENLVHDIEYFLVDNHAIDNTQASKLANTFTQEMIRSFSGSTPRKYPETHRMILERIESPDLMVVNQLPEQFDTLVVSGMILDSNNNDLIERYYDYLIESEHIIGEHQFIELASAKNNVQGLKLLIDKRHYKFPNDDKGSFNKTPIMYAVQNDLEDNYQYLKKAYPELLNYIMPFKDSDCGPKIRSRTVLTYALEGASYDLIKQVVNDVDRNLIRHEDSEGRNAFYYLSQNEKLSRSNKQAISTLILAKSDDFPVHRASFDCHKARSSIELLTCSSERNAQSDLNLNDKYQKAKNEVSSKDSLLREQRTWLKDRDACIDRSSFIDCYNKRINYFEKLLKLKVGDLKITTDVQAISSNNIQTFTKMKSNEQLTPITESSTKVPDFRGVYLGSTASDINELSSVIDGYMPGIWGAEFQQKGSFSCKSEVVSIEPMFLFYGKPRTDPDLLRKELSNIKICSTESAEKLKGRYDLLADGITYKFLDDKLYYIELGRLDKKLSSDDRQKQCGQLTKAVIDKFSSKKYEMLVKEDSTNWGNTIKTVLYDAQYRVVVYMSNFMEESIFTKRKEAYCTVNILDKTKITVESRRINKARNELELQKNNRERSKEQADSQYEI